MKLIYLFFWPGFEPSVDLVYSRVFVPHGIQVTHIHDLSQATLKDVQQWFEENDIAIVGNFIPEPCLKVVETFASKIVFCTTEPLDYWYPKLCELYLQTKFKGYYGCVQNYKGISLKYPLYCWNSSLEDTIRQAREKHKLVTAGDIQQKQFCCLINRHDWGQTRTEIYQRLSEVGHITCPSKLFNNFSNEEFEKIGKSAFASSFLFSICPENCATRLSGYVTEKLMDCCLYGPIPIYFGELDDVDRQIFNINRILFFRPSDPVSLQQCVDKVVNLYNDPQELLRFYQQDPFAPSALETIATMKQNLTDGMTHLLDLPTTEKVV